LQLFVVPHVNLAKLRFLLESIVLALPVLVTIPFLRARASIAMARISYGNSVCLSDCPSVCSSRLGTNSSLGEIKS